METLKEIARKYRIEFILIGFFCVFALMLGLTGCVSSLESKRRCTEAYSEGLRDGHMCAEKSYKEFMERLRLFNQLDKDGNLIPLKKK